MPTSLAMTSAISSVRAARPATILLRYSARASFGRVLQAGNAAFAAATAASTSDVAPSGMVAITSSVAESWTLRVPVPAEATHWPLM